MVSNCTGLFQTSSPSLAALGAAMGRLRPHTWEGKQATCHRVGRIHLISYHEDEQGTLSKAEPLHQLLPDHGMAWLGMDADVSADRCYIAHTHVPWLVAQRGSPEPTASAPCCCAGAEIHRSRVSCKEASFLSL